MSFRALLMLSFVLLFSCEKNNNSPEPDTTKYYYWTGKIVDQVRDEPVSGAIVSLGYRRFCERPNFETFGQGFQATSGTDGKFMIKVLKSSYSALSQPTGCPGFYATRLGYAGSTSVPFQWTKEPDNGDIGVIELIPFATLKLHVKRDPIVDIYESVELWLSRYRSSTYWYDYRIICSGINFEETFIYDSLWSNTKYTIETGPVGRRLTDPNFKTYYRGEINLLPGIINELSISFTHSNAGQ